MKTPPSGTVSIVTALSLALAPAGYTAEIIPITSFDPTTFFEGVTAGFDFDGAGGPTQSGFTSIAPGGTGTTTYNAVNNGITLDLTISNFNATAHRNRNNAAAGNLVTDFAQWYHTTNANAEAAFSFTDLNPDTDYDISFFVYNLGAGQMTHKFYEGTSSADPLITTFTTAGNQNNYSTWSPGITFRINSGASGRIDVTMQEAGSRLNMDGIAITSLAPPAAPTFNLTITPNASAGLYDFSWESQPGKIYDLVTSTDLVMPILEWPVYDPDGEGGNPPYGDIPAQAESTTTTLTAVPGDGPRRFFAVVENDPPPLLEENFDAAAALPVGWTSNGPVNGTDWEVGVPSGVASGPAAATSVPNCAGTNITGYYTENTDVSLVSPSIAIPANAAATLTFQQLLDTDTAGDVGSVRILDADNADTPIPGLQITGLQGLGSSGAGWTENSLVLPADDVGGKNIKIEFRFVSDAGTTLDQDVFGGFYIDDVVVTRN